jgi:hypothetical protein
MAMEKKVTSPTVKGVIIALILIVYSLVIQYGGFSDNKALGALQFIFIAGAVIFCCITYAKQMEGNVSFGNVFSHGFKATATFTVITVLFLVLLFNVINPELKEETLRKVEETINNNDDLGEEQIESAMEITRKYFLVLTIGSQLLFLLIFGLIASLIGAAVARKNPQNPFQQG